MLDGSIDGILDGILDGLLDGLEDGSLVSTYPWYPDKKNDQLEIGKGLSIDSIDVELLYINNDIFGM